MKRSNWILAGILILAVSLRILAITTRDIQYDDAFTILLSSRTLGEIISGTAADTMPPLFYFLLHFWGLIAKKIWFYRLLSILFNLGTVIGVYILSRSISQKAAYWSAFLFDISPMQIYHAQDIRMYSFLEFCLIWYLFFTYKYYFTENIDNSRIWYGLGIVATGTAAMYTHNIAVFIIIMPNLSLLVLRKWRPLLDLILKQVIIFTLFLPWIFQLPGQINKVNQAFWTPVPGLLQVVQTVIMWHASLPLPWKITALVAAISILLFVLVLYTFMRSTIQKPQKLYLILACTIPPITLFAVSYIMRPLFVPRVFIASQALYLVVAGIAISSTRVRWIRFAIAGLFIVASALSLPYQVTYSEFPRSPHKVASTQLEKLDMTDTIIVHNSKLSYFPFVVHSPGLNQTYISDEPGSFNDTLATETQAALDLPAADDIQSAVDEYQKVIFVTYSEVFKEYLDAGKSHPEMDWLESNYLLVDEKKYNDLHLFTFILRD